MNTKPISNSELRAMRDAIYGQPSTDKNWDACKDKWAQDAEWLQERFAAINKRKS